MRAVLLTGHGGFERLNFRDDVATPIPRADEVLIRVTAAAVNNTDINMRVGWYSKDAEGSDKERDSGWTGERVTFPLVQGADACGYIAAVGPGVTATRLGERVLVDPVLRSASAGCAAAPRYLGSDCDGAFADYVRVPARNAYPINTPLSDVELAAVPCSFTAAENMLARADVRIGETVLITGASGGVGSAAVQLAKRRGARIITVAGESKSERLLELGASRVLPRNVDLVATLGKESVDAVIDVVGGRGFPQLLEILRRGSRYAVAGAIAGPLVTLDLRILYLKDLRLLGCTIPDEHSFGNIVRYIENGEVRPVVGATYALSAMPEAQRAFLAKEHFGKIVLLP
jgi:NADPH:quinone reductase-like Zn-dependent oxidoreductase